MGLLDVWADPVSAETFRTDHLGRRSLHRPASRATLQSVAGVRTWTVPELLAGRRKTVTAWMSALDGRHLTADVSPTVAHRLYDAGTTLYLLEVDGLDAVSDAIAADLRVPATKVTCGLFCNQPGAYTPVHFDPVDTITVQLTGSKRWWIAPNPLAPQPTVAWAVRDRSVAPEFRQYGAERVVRRAVAGVAFLGAGASVGADPGEERWVEMSVQEQGVERRSTLALGADQEAALRLLTDASGPLSAAELADRVPGLAPGRACELLDLLAGVGFLRPAG